MSDELFRSSDQLVQALPRFPSPDYLVPRMQLADEKLTWRTLVASGAAEHFANSFIALAVKGEGPSLWEPGAAGGSVHLRPAAGVRRPQRDPGDGGQAAFRADGAVPRARA